MSDRTTKQTNDQMRVNLSIWKDTVQKSEFYNTDKSIKYNKPIEDSDISNKLKDLREYAKKHPPFVKVFHENIYDTLSALSKEGFKKTLLINPGNNNFPIPGVQKGATGDEMELFRRSNYYLAIEESQFAILEGQCLYSPTVVIFKNANFKRMEDTVSVSILNIPPLHDPRLVSIQHPSGKGYIEIFDSKNDEEKARNKIFTMFRIAVMHDHDTIVISNYGSGSNNNPIEKTIELFNEAIEKYPIPYVFFAIKTNKKREKDKDFHIYHKYIYRLS